MRKHLTIYGLICSVFLFCLVTGCISCSGNIKSATGRNYYVSPEGDDGNRGTINKPWKSLGKINNTNLKPGDHVFLKGGKVFKGTLFLDSLDKGLVNNKIIISSYGNGRAVIDGGNAEGIFISDCREFAVSNLIVKGNGRKEGNSKDGIYISDSKRFTLDSIEVSGFQHSGIHIHKGTEIDIRHVFAHDNGFAGINISGTTIYSKTDFDNENIYIGFCVADNNPGDPTVTDNHSGNGILVSSARKCTIEYCEASDNGWDMPWTGNGPVGIWIWDCNGVIIQHCISHDNKTNPVAKDGGGFDLDGGVSESVIQYCVSYNNQGAGYGLFEFGAAKAWENNTIRYNISRNDGIKNPGSVSVWKGEGAGIMRDCEIYNNTFYSDTTSGVSLYVLNNCQGFNFRNNIFIYRKDFVYPGQKLKTEQFQSNCYWSLAGNHSFMGFRNIEEWANTTGNEKVDGKFTWIYANPLLIDPATIFLTDPAEINLSTLSGYSLKPESPLIDKGLDLKIINNKDVPLKDIAGTVVPQNKYFDIGALEWFEK